MKKIFLLFVFIFSIGYINSQPNLITVSDGYEFELIDAQTYDSFYLFLGETEEDAIASIEDMLNWFNKAKDGDYVGFIDIKGFEATFFKGIKWMISDGDKRFCEEENNQLKRQLLELPTDFQTNNCVVISYIDKKYFKQSIKELKKIIKYREKIKFSE